MSKKLITDEEIEALQRLRNNLKSIDDLIKSDISTVFEIADHWQENTNVPDKYRHRDAQDLMFTCNEFRWQLLFLQQELSKLAMFLVVEEI